MKNYIVIKTAMTSYQENRDSSMIKFQEMVNERIMEGYRPQGGICVDSDDEGNGQYFYQAMIHKSVIGG